MKNSNCRLIAAPDQSRRKAKGVGARGLVGLGMAGFLALGLLLGGCQKEGGASTVRFLTDWYPEAEHGGYYYAQLHGYYKEAGIDVQILPAGATVNGIQGLATGKVDFCMVVSDDVLVARARGLPVVAVCAHMEHNPKAIMFHENDPIQGFEDLSGRTVSVTPGATWFAYTIKKFNLQNIKQTPTAIGSASFLVDPKAVFECFVTSEPFQLQRQGQTVRSLLVKDTGYDPYRCIVAAEQTVKNRPEMVKAFVEASNRGWVDYLRDPSDTDKELLRLNPQMTQEVIDNSRKLIREQGFLAGDPALGEGIGRMDAARWQHLYQILRDIKVIPSDFDYHQAFTLDFVGTSAPPVEPKPKN